ncbi:hypothetical protein [Pseudomonas sp. M30-35]|uniref:hypothetical protein n=1 Tax=Pseudomonas sp. M30-35 TaxID=1981174 RepID=UPI000B3D422C|nr:hypothetical protein [Pseudomonas sp. M30-35]ARU88446.1 hypothetical protein B9K09_10940 [Pseudomonas sp. M30-35]
MPCCRVQTGAIIIGWLPSLNLRTGSPRKEIDLLNFVFLVNGEDRLAEPCKAIGLYQKGAA